MTKHLIWTEYDFNTLITIKEVCIISSNDFHIAKQMMNSFIPIL